MEVSEKLLKSNMEVLKHIALVRALMYKMIQELNGRACEHDKSKLESPEAEVFADNFEALAKVEYGSPEYTELLKKVQPAIDHHYAKNRHHPQHHPNGVDDMDLIDLCEMLCDWMASTEKNKNGNIHRSIQLNTERFNLSPQLAQILKNTVDRYF